MADEATRDAGAAVRGSEAQGDQRETPQVRAKALRRDQGGQGVPARTEARRHLCDQAVPQSIRSNQSVDEHYTPSDGRAVHEPLQPIRSYLEASQVQERHAELRMEPQ